MPPEARKLVTHEATREESATAAQPLMVVPSSSKSIVPVGVPEAVLTVAVSVVLAPVVVGFAPVVRAVVVAAAPGGASTVMVSAAEFDTASSEETQKLLVTSVPPAAVTSTGRLRASSAVPAG